MLAADDQLTFRIAGGDGELRRGLGHHLHDEVLVELHIGAVNLAARLFQDGDGLGVQHLDPELLEDAHGPAMDALHPFGIQRFHRAVRVDRDAPRHLIDDRGSGALLVASAAPGATLAAAGPSAGGRRPAGAAGSGLTPAQPLAMRVMAKARARLFCRMFGSSWTADYDGSTRPSRFSVRLARSAWPVLIPALLFLAGALISFTTGTSWGTFAILIPIGMPMVELLGLPPSLVLAAILSGGVFGDHCSPISDSTAVSSVASGCDLLEHVKTQLPYALFCGALALLAFLLAGVLMI